MLRAPRGEATAEDGRAAMVLSCGHVHHPNVDDELTGRDGRTATDPTKTISGETVAAEGVGAEDVLVDCGQCDARVMPASVVPGRRTPAFTADTVPPGLRAAHQTSVWAQLLVTEGSVEFVEDETGWRATATAADVVTIVPNRPHHVVPDAEAVFSVQFFDFVEDDPDEGGRR